MSHRPAGIHPASGSPPERAFVWGLGLSLLLHALLLVLSFTLLPAVAGRRSATRVPQVLTFRFRDRTAETDPASRTTFPPPTPLLGRFDSQARDRIPGDRDTAVPAGGLRATDNSLPAGEAGAATGGEATAERPAGVEAGGIGIADALGSEVALLTGRREAVRRAGGGSGHGARSDADLGEPGALLFGDFAFSTRAWDWEPYWSYMRDRLYANWHPPAAYKDFGIIQGGWTLVRAVLDRRGRLLDARILGRDGHASLHPASFAAMQGAAPFRPLPAEFPEDSLVVTVRFIYLPPGVMPDRATP